MVAIGAGVAFAMGAAPADAQTATAGQVLISEFRLRGPSGAQDEFIELYNNSGASHTVVAASGTGYGVAASDGTTRCSIPNGTVIPNRGHYLCVNSATYSLGAYPGGNGTTATGDATYTTDIPDNAGIAIFNNNTGGGSYSLANRLDAVGSTSEANTTYKEGTGYPALTPFSIDYSFYRDDCGKQGSITTMGACTVSTPVDTDNNATNFIFVDTNGTSAGAGQRLGAPGPQNLSSPIQRNGTFAVLRADATVATTAPPNRVRDFTSDPAQQLHVRDDFAPAAVREQHRRQRHPPALPGRRHHHVPRPVGLRRSAAALVGFGGGRGHQRRRDLRGHRCAGHAALHRDRPGHDPRDAASAAERLGLQRQRERRHDHAGHAAGQRREHQPAAPERDSADRQLQGVSEHRSPAVTRR